MVSAAACFGRYRHGVFLHLFLLTQYDHHCQRQLPGGIGEMRRRA